MKSSFVHIAMLALAGAVGCGQGTPGGPGTTDTTVKKPIYGQAEDTFNLSVPMMSSSLQQGEQIEAEIGIERARNFGEDVELMFSDVPTGVTITPAGAVIRHGDTNAKVTFAAGDEVSPGEYKVKIAGHPTKGGDAQIEFKLTIAAKDSFSLSVPLLSTSLKQGETKAVSISIRRDKKFNEDVALKFGEMPTGVSLEPGNPVIKPGETKTELTLTAVGDAALGDFTINVTGHPSAGADASGEFKLSVVKE